MGVAGGMGHRRRLCKVVAVEAVAGLRVATGEGIEAVGRIAGAIDLF